MADQQTSYGLSPQLGTVLRSLSVNLESELNRYRCNRRYDRPSSADLFADLEDDSFDLEAVGSAVDASLVAAVTASRAALPPSVPPNKKLFSRSPAALPQSGSPQFGVAALPPALSAPLAVLEQRYDTPEDSSVAVPSALTGALIKASAFQPLASQPLLYGEDASDLPASSQELGKTASSGYLASSERLIESLTEVPPMPEPDDPTIKPKRKTVSLLAGASLGFVALIAGLGASYLMANPQVTQRLASSVRGTAPDGVAAPVSTFDPPGPDLSANEFIDLDIDNLSSLKMPQSAVSPDVGTVNPADMPLENPAAASGLPPIQGASGSAIAVNPAPTSTPTETQAVIVPVGLTYYVTAPFTTAQNLIDIRSSVNEAFVRRFSDGNRIQMAAFDNPQAAQTFVEEMQAQDIAAQIYGPTSE